MQLDHVCVAVRSIETASKKLCQVLGYAPRTEVVTNTRQRVNVRFFAKPGCLDIKLIEPVDEESPLCQFLKRGEGLHHLGFRVDSVPHAVDALRERGARVTAGPAPGEAFDDHLIAFLYAAPGLNIEVIDTDERRACLAC